jgi:hypothetical protein
MVTCPPVQGLSREQAHSAARLGAASCPDVGRTPVPGETRPFAVPISVSASDAAADKAAEMIAGGIGILPISPPDNLPVQDLLRSSSMDASTKATKCVRAAGVQK